MLQENRAPEEKIESQEIVGVNPGPGEVSNLLARLEGKPIIDAADSSGQDRLAEDAKREAVEAAILVMEGLTNATNSRIDSLEAALKNVANGANDSLQEASGGAAFYGLDGRAVNNRSDILSDVSEALFLRKMEATGDIGELPGCMENCAGMMGAARKLKDELEGGMPDTGKMQALRLKLNMTL